MSERKYASREGAKVTLTIERTYRNQDPETVRVTRQEMEATVVDGIVRWDSNGHVPPADTLEEMLAAKGITTNEFLASGRARDAETAEFLAAYRKAEANRVPSAEEMYEMRAAFGEGTEVVNVITGRVTRL